MAEEKRLPQLVARAVISRDFRTALAKDPEKVIKAEGYSVTPDEVAGLKELKVEEWDTVTVKEVNELTAPIFGTKVVLAGVII